MKGAFLVPSSFVVLNRTASSLRGVKRDAHGRKGSLGPDSIDLKNLRQILGQVSGQMFGDGSLAIQEVRTYILFDVCTNSVHFSGQNSAKN